MKKIIFGGIYIIAGLLFAIVLYMYKITPVYTNLGYVNILAFLSVIIGVYFTFLGLFEDS